MDQGDGESDLIGLEAIDRGMRPEGAAARFIDKDDICGADDRAGCGPPPLPCFKIGAAGGHAPALRRDRPPDHQAVSRTPGLPPDRDLVIGQADFYKEVLDFRVDGDPPTMALKWLSELEREVSTDCPGERRGRIQPPKSDWSWEKLLLDEFGKSGSKLPPEVEERARKEKAEALAKLYEGRFSVLCGQSRDRQDLSAERLPQGPGAD